jgi:hypothetical protein
MMARISAVGCAAGAMLAATPAFGQAAPVGGPFGFGAPGQVAISTDFWMQGGALVGTHAEISPGGNSPPSTTTVALMPALDVFVARNFSVGGQIVMLWLMGGARATSIGVAPRVGYDVPIADKISFWPKGALSFSQWSDRNASGSHVTAEVYTPFLLHPAPHFFVGLGPLFSFDLLSRQDGRAANRNVDFAVSTTVGGWF